MTCSCPVHVLFNVLVALLPDAGSGVQKIVYTTDGTDPTSTNGATSDSRFRNIAMARWHLGEHGIPRQLAPHLYAEQ